MLLMMMQIRMSKITRKYPNEEKPYVIAASGVMYVCRPMFSVCTPDFFAGTKRGQTKNADKFDPLWQGRVPG